MTIIKSPRAIEREQRQKEIEKFPIISKNIFIQGLYLADFYDDHYFWLIKLRGYKLEIDNFSFNNFYSCFHLIKEINLIYTKFRGSFITLRTLDNTINSRVIYPNKLKVPKLISDATPLRDIWFWDNYWRNMFVLNREYDKL